MRTQRGPARKQQAHAGKIALEDGTDIEPDDQAKTLTIRIHRMANPCHDKAVTDLLNELTLQGFCHPETGAKMIYTLV